MSKICYSNDGFKKFTKNNSGIPFERAILKKMKKIC